MEFLHKEKGDGIFKWIRNSFFSGKKNKLMKLRVKRRKIPYLYV